MLSTRHVALVSRLSIARVTIGTGPTSHVTDASRQYEDEEDDGDAVLLYPVYIPPSHTTHGVMLLASTDSR